MKILKNIIKTSLVFGLLTTSFSDLNAGFFKKIFHTEQKKDELYDISKYRQYIPQDESILEISMNDIDQMKSYAISGLNREITNYDLIVNYMLKCVDNKTYGHNGDKIDYVINVQEPQVQSLRKKYVEFIEQKKSNNQKYDKGITAIYLDYLNQFVKIKERIDALIPEIKAISNKSWAERNKLKKLLNELSNSIKSCDVAATTKIVTYRSEFLGARNKEVCKREKQKEQRQAQEMKESLEKFSKDFNERFSKL